MFRYPVIYKIVDFSNLFTWQFVAFIHIKVWWKVSATVKSYVSSDIEIRPTNSINASLFILNKKIVISLLIIKMKENLAKKRK